MTCFHSIIFLYLLASSTCLKLPSSLSHYGFRLLIAKSYGTPVKLICEDHKATNITIKDISLFKWKRTTDAELIFPGIHKQSDGECQHSLQRDNSSPGVECSLTFSRRKIPSDLLIVAVYVCVSFPRLQKMPIYRTR